MDDVTLRFSRSITPTASAVPMGTNARFVSAATISEKLIATLAVIPATHCLRNEWFIACPFWSEGFSKISSPGKQDPEQRSEEHTSELQSRENLVCRLLLEKKK